jgi:hypothetical protein
MKKYDYVVTVIDTLNGSIEVPDDATEDDIIDAIYEDIGEFDIKELDWDIDLLGSDNERNL